MSDFEYSNGADGSCQECGAETAEEWHAVCPDCFAEQQGWRTTDSRTFLETDSGASPDPQPWREPRPPAGTPPESFVVALSDVRRELAELRRRLERLEGAA